MESILINFSETHRLIAYLVIFLAVLVEGELVLILGGILSRNGYLDLFDVFFIAFLGVIIHDLLYWSIGKKLLKMNRKRILFINLEKIGVFLEKLRSNNDGVYIFLSKFTWNFNRLVLAASGYLGLPFKKLMQYSLPANLIWTITFVSLGYIFAYKTDLLRQEVKTALLFLTGFIIIIIVLEWGLRKIINSTFKRDMV